MKIRVGGVDGRRLVGEVLGRCGTGNLDLGPSPRRDGCLCFISKRIPPFLSATDELGTKDLCVRLFTGLRLALDESDGETLVGFELEAVFGARR